MKRYPKLAVVLSFVALSISGQSLEYGSPEDLCGTTSLFVDSGTYLEGRNNIVSTVKKAGLPNLAIASNIASADVLIRLTRSGNRNWAEWSLFVRGSSGALRMIERVADTDEGDGLKHFWPSSKVARKFVELHQTANRSPACKPSVPETRHSPKPPVAEGELSDVLRQLSEHFSNVTLDDLSVDPAVHDLMQSTHADILKTLTSLNESEETTAIGKLERLELLNELQRELDFFWFGLESWGHPATGEAKVVLEKAKKRNLAFTKYIYEIRGQVGLRLLEDVVRCEQTSE